MMNPTFYWHDYETFGIDPGSDRISQFAGIRTDQDLNPIGKPLVQYCKPADDFLPDPFACLVTGISPQLCLEKGLPEYQFIKNIHHELATANTCTVGYNNLRFDDEFTRFSFYRNFIDPYAREWQNGNSRWDIIDLARMTAALRPQGINWPLDEDYKKLHPEKKSRRTFRLEKLTQANGISHQDAHDALSDVYATIDFAKLIKNKQPKLFDFYLALRNKHKVSELLNIYKPQPLIHISGMYRSEYNYCAIVLPIMPDPNNNNAIIVYDCRYNPAELEQLSVEQMQQRLFTKTSELEALGLSRLALKTIHINKCPAIAPLNTLDSTAQEQAQIDLTQQKANANLLLTLLNNNQSLKTKLSQSFTKEYDTIEKDVDAALYTGGFFSNTDREQMNQILNSPPDKLLDNSFHFSDSRLDDLLFRYKGRNFKDLILQKNDKELIQEWDEYRFDRMTNKHSPSQMTIDKFNEQIEVAFSQESRVYTEKEKQLKQDLLNYPSLLKMPSI